ncbi:MAG TPA: PDDEXK nuclease domain-containing protein [Terriglobia bacterium]|nr:PDDEXK nuclease domain-containing protein [Terriglobia bacterium]
MTKKNPVVAKSYDGLLEGVVHLLEEARRSAARSVNAIVTAIYWEIGHRIVEHEQQGKRRADYGEALLGRLAADLTGRFGRGFSERNLGKMRLFYLSWKIPPTLSAKSSNDVPTGGGIPPTVSAISAPVAGIKLDALESDAASLRSPARFPLPWSHYVRLLSVDNPEARAFYEHEALRGGWSARQLDRQISTLFYDRTLLSRKKAAMLRRGVSKSSEGAITPEEEIKDPLILEFLGLKDEYSESALEEALILHLEHFLLELGNDFAFVARQKRLRVGDEWYRIDLVFFHRRLKCLILIDLKTGKFTHADAGQMNLYLNFAQEHWTHPGENPAVGLILCAKGDEAVAHYALGNLRNKVLAGEYRLALPAEKKLVAELERTQKALEAYYRRRAPS